MKLHLPKLLLTAVLATAYTYTSSATTGWGTGSNNGKAGAVYYIDKEEGIEINATGRNENILSLVADAVGVDAHITSATVKQDITMAICVNPWPNPRRAFDSLLIDTLYIQNDGAIDLQVQDGIPVTIKQVSGVLKSVTNTSQLTIGTDSAVTSLAGPITNTGTMTLKGVTSLAGTITNTGTMTLEGTVNLGKTLSNNGILNLDSVVKLDDFAASITDSELTNGTHGFRSGLYSYDIASGGTINTTEGFTASLDGKDITEKLIISGSSITYTAQRTGTIYEITSAHTSKVVYNGSVGEMASASGFYMENGTALELAASTAALRNGITIAAGGEGSVTLDFTGGTHDFDALVDTQSGICNLNISGEGTVVSTTHTGPAGFVNGKIDITDRGKLVLGNYDALGYTDDDATPSIGIQNGTLAVGGRLTLKTNLDLSGNATITTAENSLTGNNAPMLQSFGSTWAVSGTGNVIESGVHVKFDKDLLINVASNGELSIQGTTSQGNNGGKLTKDGGGKLILDGEEKSINHQLQMLAGTLQLGGSTEADGLVTLAVGINQTGGTVDVVGKAKIQGTSTLGGAITVASTGELTLNSTYTLTGSLTVAAGGKVIGGSDLVGKNDAPTAPAEGTNGWGTTTVTILKSAADATVNGLNSVWYNDKEYTISTSVAEGITSHQFNAQGTSYYVQNTAEAVEYSTASGLTQAEAIYMSNGTTLNVRENLNFSGLTIADGAKVKFDVQGATLNINVDNNVNNIAELTIGQGGEVCLANWNTSLGNSGEDGLVNVLLTDGGKFTFKNGNSDFGGGAMYVNMTVEGSGVLAGSNLGNNSDIIGEVKGNGTLSLESKHGANQWEISATVKDSEGGKLGITSNTTVTMSGENTYSGGTTITGGKLTTADEKALGTGTVKMQGGELAMSAALGVSAMEYNGGTVNNNGNNLTVRDTLTVKSDMEITGAGATTIGTLELAADTTLTTSGALTLGSITLDLSGYTAGYSNTLVSATNGGISWNEKSWTSTGLGTGLVANVGFADESQTTLKLTISAAEEEITSVKTSVTGVVGYEAATDMLTLLVDEKVTSGTIVSLDLITDPDLLAAIRTALGDADDMFRITVQYDDTHKVVAESFDQVVFYNEKGQGYWGEMVDLGGNVGTKLAYKLDRIPEPTTTTLSLLALCGLAARRRRK